MIDDASHLLAPTRASFEALFPSLREDGLFVIEDWNYQHLVSDAVAQIRNPDPEQLAELERRISRAPEPPLSRLVVELVLLAAESDEFVREVKIDSRSVRVRGGVEPWIPSTFSVAGLIHDDLGLLDMGPRTPNRDKLRLMDENSRSGALSRTPPIGSRKREKP